jgi:dolichol-phosphate mannosyltransferase
VEAGAEVVAIRVSIDKQPILRRLGSSLYYWLMGKISKLDMASKPLIFVCLIKGRGCIPAGDRTNACSAASSTGWGLGKNTSSSFDAREEGAAGYSYANSATCGQQHTSFLFPLRITTYLGVIITVLSSLLLVFMLAAKFYFAPRLFTSLAFVVVANTFLNGIVLMSIGLVALYIGTIHTEVINRPLYIVRERLNFVEQDQNKHNDKY